MVKYSSSLKAKIVGEYLQGNISAKGIAEKYYLPRRQVAHWIQRYRLSV
ncbi:helix-turn-helix domain-containing protein [Lactiplantibacillus plantarum]|nr:helix-turn-helix domain-containing protein [Lactiplantibacillus plantarum]